MDLVVAAFRMAEALIMTDLAVLSVVSGDHREIANTAIVIGEIDASEMIENAVDVTGPSREVAPKIASGIIATIEVDGTKRNATMPSRMSLRKRMLIPFMVTRIMTVATDKMRPAIINRTTPILRNTTPATTITAMATNKWTTITMGPLFPTINDQFYPHHLLMSRVVAPHSCDPPSQNIAFNSLIHLIHFLLL